MGLFRKFYRSVCSFFGGKEVGRTGCCRGRNSTKQKKPSVTPLPLTKMVVLCAVLFVSQFGINMIFPFLPFMVHDFFPYLDKDELGRKAGYLGGAYFLGNLFGSFIWGMAADKVGRRTVLLLGVFFIIVSELFFGFSQNMVWAVSARLLWGLFNGNIGVAKTYISEICDDTNLAKGFAAVGTTGGIGRLMGSVIGGFLAQPANKYHLLEFQLFCDYPYCLPCLVGAGLSMFSLLAAWLFLDETLKKDEKDSLSLNQSSEGQDSGIDLINTGSDDSSNNHSEDSSESNSGEANTEEDESVDVFVDDIETDSDYDASSDTELLQNIQRLNQRSDAKLKLVRFRTACVHAFNPLRLARKIMQRLKECMEIFVCIAVCIKKLKYSNYRPSNVQSSVSLNWKSVGSKAWKTILLLKDRRVIVSIVLYGLIAFLAIIANELFPLLLVTDHEHGGYNMDPSEIGVILSAGAVLQLFFQSLVYPKVVKILKYRKTFIFGLILFAIGIFVLPFSNQISGPISAQGSNSSGSGDGLDVSIPFCGPDSVDDLNSTNALDNSITRIPARVWAVLIVIFVISIVGRVVSITSVMVFISNSSVPSTRATINGYGQSVAALMRMIGPMTGAPLFAWSETLNKHWPLNYHLVFDLLAIGSIGSIAVTLLLPHSIEQKRENVAISSSNDAKRDSTQTVDVELVSVKTAPENSDSEENNNSEELSERI